MSESIDEARRAYYAARDRYRETRTKEAEVAMLDAFYHWQHLKAEAERLLG